MAQCSPDGYSRVEPELAILLRRAHANSCDLSRDIHPGLQATAYALLARLHDLGKRQGCGPQRLLRHRQAGTEPTAPSA